VQPFADAVGLAIPVFLRAAFAFGQAAASVGQAAANQLRLGFFGFGSCFGRRLVFAASVPAAARASESSRLIMKSNSWGIVTGSSRQGER
jgi:hypothetical protein